MGKTKNKKSISRLAAFIKHPFIRKNEPLLHTVEWIFVLVAFFSIGFPVIYYQTENNIFEEGKLHYIGGKGATAPPTPEEKKFVGETIPAPVIDINGWDTYRNQWYGFEIKHPDSWTSMQYRTATAKTSRFETIYKFRKDASGENDPYVGFDMVIYPAKKVSGLESTNDIQKKEDAPEDISSCQFSEQVTLGEENNEFQKVNIQESNACYKEAYFFSTSKGNYIYDIVPITKDGADPVSNLEQDANKNFPEYKEVVASLKLIPITRPLSVPSKPRITAPRPVSAIVSGGRLVCAKKNDHPGKSQNGNKPGHMDMECCLDPDETPNPWCTYSNPIYKKYL